MHPVTLASREYDAALAARNAALAALRAAPGLPTALAYLAALDRWDAAQTAWLATNKGAVA